MASNYGVPTVIDQEGVVLDMTTSKFGERSLRGAS